jgi:hypothetical protein
MRLRIPYAHAQALAWLAACALLGAPIGAVIAWYRSGKGT